MKIIDFESYGNVVRFYYGLNNCNDYHWDSWQRADEDDRVYSEYIKGYIDIAVDSDHAVLTPFASYPESHISKDDLKDRKAPCIVIIKQTSNGIYDWNRFSPSDYTRYSGADCKDSVRIYYGDDVKVLDQFTILQKCKCSKKTER
jgi:hypothetical protein